MAINIKNSIFKRWFRGILRNKKAIFGLTLIIIFIFISTIGPFFVQDPLEFLGTPLSAPSFDHFLGTNGQGQDVLSQTVTGARQTLLVGFTTGILVVFIGALIGGFSGYYGGKLMMPYHY